MAGMTQKQINFAQCLFEGYSQREAYRRAGYSTKPAMAIVDVKASQLAANGKIKVRLRELRKAAEDASIMSVVERKARLSEIGRANLRDHINDGEPIIDGPTPGAVSQYSVVDTKFGSRRSLKLHDPISAIAELNKMERVYEPERGGDTHNTQINIIVQSEKGQQLLQRVLAGGGRPAQQLPDGCDVQTE